MENSHNCTSCNDINTFRYLLNNNCLCSGHYFDNGTSNPVCDICDYTW